MLCTHVGAAPIFARAPQAKGRVARLWWTFRIAWCTNDIRSVEPRTGFLGRLLQDFYARVAVRPKTASRPSTPLPPGFYL